MNNYMLFARPSFFAGFAQIMDFANTLFEYNVSNTPNQADYLAVLNDWKVISEDIREAMAMWQGEAHDALAQQSPSVWGEIEKASHLDPSQTKV